MSELLAHAFGDYVVQSDWMAAEKTTRHGPAALHAASYAACFLPLTRSWKALAVIGGTHFVIDRWRLAKHVGWLKNQAAPKHARHGSFTRSASVSDTSVAKPSTSALRLAAIGRLDGSTAGGIRTSGCHSCKLGSCGRCQTGRASGSRSWAGVVSMNHHGQRSVSGLLGRRRGNRHDQRPVRRGNSGRRGLQLPTTIRQRRRSARRTR
jgi:hypothetical protein